MLRWLSILVVALALVAAGCGGGSDEASSDSTSTVTETTTDETTTDTETTTDETGNDTSGATSGFPSADCLKAATAFSALAAAAAGAQTGGDSSESLQNFENFANEAPDEIKGDISVLAAGYAAYLKVWNELGVKQGEQLSSDQIAKLAAASEAFNTSDFQAASTHWDAWVADNCN